MVIWSQDGMNVADTIWVFLNPTDRREILTVSGSEGGVVLGRYSSEQRAQAVLLEMGQTRHYFYMPQE